MSISQTKPRPSDEDVLAGVRRAVQKVIEQSERTDEELVIARDEKPVRIKACGL